MNHLNPKVSRLIRKIAQASLISGGLAVMAGCASEPESHNVSAPPPPTPVAQVGVAQPQQQPTQVYVTGNNSAQPQNGVVVVTQAPPSLQQEVVLAQPSSSHKWIPGYWTWRNNRYEWMAGHWEVPPTSNSVWVAPRWEHRTDGSYQFYEGYWN